MIAYHAALNFCWNTFLFLESTLISDIFANQRFCCILRKLIFPIAKDCVFVFSAEADYCYFYADLRLKILCEYY